MKHHNGIYLALTTLLLSVALMASCSAQTTARYETPASGPLISTNSMHAETLSVTFKLGAFNAVNGGHLVIGRGDLERYFTGGKPPLGSGVIFGEATGCGTPGQISALVEDWFETKSANDYSTCTNGLNVNSVYTVVVRKDGYTLSEGSVVIANVQRAATTHETTGYFIFGAESATPYELRSVKVTNGPIKERLK
jgi:hypothetical protein